MRAAGTKKGVLLDARRGLGGGFNPPRPPESLRVRRGRAGVLRGVKTPLGPSSISSSITGGDAQQQYCWRELGCCQWSCFTGFGILHRVTGKQEQRLVSALAWQEPARRGFVFLEDSL